MARRAAPLILLCAVALAATVIILSGPSRYHVTAIFDQVNGLVAGAQVEAAGTNVGSVDAISLGPDGLPRVRLAIDNGYRLRQGATADISMFSLAGEFNRFVSLQAGAGRELTDGATIGLAKTAQPVEIEQLLSTIDPRTAADVRALLAGLDGSTTGRGPDIAGTLLHSAGALRNTASLLQEVDADGRSLRALVRNGSAVMRTLASDPASVGATADTLARLLRSTALRQDQLAASTRLLAPGLRAPRLALARLDRSAAALDLLVRTAQPGVRSLVPFSVALRPTLRAAPPALSELAALITDAPADLDALAPLLRTASPTLRVLAPVLSSSNPILDQLRVRLPDLFSFFANWADFTANYDANGHAARVGLVFPPAPITAVPPDQQRAGSLMAPFQRAPGVLGGQPWTDYSSSLIGSGGVR